VLRSVSDTMGVCGAALNKNAGARNEFQTSGGKGLKEQTCLQCRYMRIQSRILRRSAVYGTSQKVATRKNRKK